jgi:hypothetical protein
LLLSEINAASATMTGGAVLLMADCPAAARREGARRTDLS